MTTQFMTVGDSTIFVNEGVQGIIAEHSFTVEGHGFWMTIGHLGNSSILVDNNEWNAFVGLINDIDKAIKDLKREY